MKTKINNPIIILDFINSDDLRNKSKKDRSSSTYSLENIKFSKGLYINREGWHIEFKQMASFMPLTTNKLDWSTISTMYRHPNITLSRDKLSCLKDKYNIKVIRDKTKADVEVVSEKTFMSLVSSKYSVSLSSLRSVKALFKKHEEAMSEDLMEEMNNIFDNPDNQETLFVLNNRNSYYNRDLSSDEVKAFLSDVENMETSHLNYIAEENFNTYNYLLSNQNKTVLDTYVNEVASEDSITIDGDIYKKISLMLESVNDDDVTMGMTMMSNCNIENSKTHLGLLFFHYMENLKHIKTWNQVGFKSLRKSFDKYMIGGWNSGHTSRYTRLIELLAKDGALTTSAVESVLDLVFKNVLSSAGFGNDGSIDSNANTSAFVIQRPHVTLSDTYKKKIKTENITLSELICSKVDDLPF